MKNKLKKIVSLALVAIVISCNSGPNHLATVQLNNGELWDANIETTEGVHNMQQVIYNYETQFKTESIMAEKTELEKIEDYHTVNNELKKEFNLIIKNCSMDGEAHEQLHNYIKPMLAMFTNIDSDNIELIERDYQALKAQLGAYNSFFK